MKKILRSFIEWALKNGITPEQIIEFLLNALN